MRIILPAVCCLLLATAVVSHAQSERDGKEWTSHNESWKYTYITGLLDGVTTGEDFTLPTMSKGSIILYKEDKACLEKAQTTVDYNTSRFFFGLTLKDFVEGLDAFYQDPANRNIPVNKAVRVWALKRKNIPEADELLKDLREEWDAPH
jgi:fluoride ion exporter CrcB/FEX